MQLRDWIVHGNVVNSKAPWSLNWMLLPMTPWMSNATSIDLNRWVMLCVYRGILSKSMTCHFDNTLHISTYGCFQKKWYPQIIHFNSVFHYKPSIFGGTTIFGNTHFSFLRFVFLVFCSHWPLTSKGVVQWFQIMECMFVAVSPWGRWSWLTPPKTNMEPQNWWFLDVSPMKNVGCKITPRLGCNHHQDDLTLAFYMFSSTESQPWSSFSTTEHLFHIPRSTLPETNGSSENWWLVDYFPFLGRPIFRCELLVFGRVYQVIILIF